jgi:NAD(P)-dependent dehydrogenase (short-subunit alcohol dehydrogenase family)
VARVVLVTGASAGIGRACADQLHDAGWTVVGASRRGTGGGAGDRPSWAGLVMDVDHDDDVAAAIATVHADHGRIDAVVASAGWGLAGPVEQTTVAEAKSQFETNYFGVVRTVTGVLPIMRTQGEGRVVIIGSIGGVIGIPFQAHYSASKFALEGLAEALAYEVAQFGIDVTVIEPGNVRTGFTDARRRAVGASDGPYGPALARAIAVMERDERDGAPAADVATAVSRVLGARHPPRRRSVGKAGERVGTTAKRLLPFRVFEAAAKGSLGV